MKNLLLLAVFFSTLISHAQVTLIDADFESDFPDAELPYFTGFKYNYTTGLSWDKTAHVPGSLVFYHGSQTNIFITLDPLDANNNVLYVDGFVNLVQDNSARGMFFLQLDLTGGGAYTEAGGPVTVHYSFRMMRVATPAEELDSTTAWEIAWISWDVNPDNADLDAFFWEGQSVVDSFNTSGNKETWVTVEGSFTADLSQVDTSGMLNTGIHVYGTNGGFVSGGAGIYYVDDVLVAVSQGEVQTPTWAGYEIDEVTGTVDTGSWMGLLYVEHAPFVYSYDMQAWLYIDSDTQNMENGAWVYIPR